MNPNSSLRRDCLAPSFIPVMDFPLYRISPLVRFLSVDIVYIMVDFPLPDGPIIPTSPLSGKLMLIFLIAYTFSSLSIS